MSGTKRCLTCATEKERSEYNVDRSKVDGLDIRCTSCRSAYRSAYRQANAVALRTYGRDYNKRFAAATLAVASATHP